MGGSLSWDSSLLQIVQLRNDSAAGGVLGGDHTQYSFEVTEEGKYCVFTEHVPAEFLATYLKRDEGGGSFSYHFPTYARLYGVSGNPTESESAGPAPTDSPAASPTLLLLALVFL